MIHTSITRSCTVFLLRRELSRSAIYGSQILTPINGRPCQSGKKKTTQFRGIFVQITVFYFYNIFLTIYILQQMFTERFSKTNSTDPRQRVHLTIQYSLSLLSRVILVQLCLIANFNVLFSSQTLYRLIIPTEFSKVCIAASSLYSPGSLILAPYSNKIRMMSKWLCCAAKTRGVTSK